MTTAESGPRERRHPTLSILIALSLAVSSLMLGCASAGDTSVTDGGLLVRLDDRDRVMRMIDAGDPDMTRSLGAIKREAEEALATPVVPVTAGKEDGKRVAPSGDPHDYVSLSPYWWPNPDTDDGLPYIRRDGEVNPDRYKYDTPKLGDFGNTVWALGFAYHITRDERYAKRAAEHLRAWFVDPATRMRPRMAYSQFVPGVSDGRSVGIIDTNRIRWVADAVLMLERSPHWTEADMAATREWYGQYAEWLMTSELAHLERTAENNHGTWFHAQAMQYALMGEKPEITRELAAELKDLMASQITPDGAQPHELTRTRSLHYYDFNIRAYMDAAAYAEKVGIDLASYKAPNGASIRRALDHALPYFVDPSMWEHEQISPPNQSMFHQTLRRAARVWDDAKYEAAAEALPTPEDSYLWIDLIIPPIHDVEGMDWKDMR